MASLDTLSAFGSELTAEQMDTVDGGIIPVLLVVNGILKLTFVYLAVSG